MISLLEGPRRAVTVLKSGKLIISEVILYSVGRIGATADLGLAAAGLQADERGRLRVNEVFQTAQPHIYAAGDVIGFPALASTSMEQGRLAACHAFGIRCASLPHLFPYGIYSVPEISTVGKNEEELTATIRWARPHGAGRGRLFVPARGRRSDGWTRPVGGGTAGVRRASPRVHPRGLGSGAGDRGAIRLASRPGTDLPHP